MVTIIPEIQQAIIPHNNEKLNHQKILLVAVLWYNLQHNNFFFQHIQLNTHPIILSPANATKIKYTPTFLVYSDFFDVPLAIPISVFYVIKIN